MSNTHHILLTTMQCQGADATTIGPVLCCQEEEEKKQSAFCAFFFFSLEDIISR